MTRHPQLAAGVGALLLCMALANSARAFLPQTIVVDGTNDFLNANLVENDSLDTQFSQIDLRRVYITNDANKLYFGFGQDKTGWTQVQIGVMISTPTKNGATTDMWSHRINWGGTHTPGYGAYKNYDNNWQEFRTWTGTAWSAPLRAGPGANGMSNGTSFQEISFLLCELGVAANDSIWFEVVVTQDGSTKGPLDLSKHDAVQLSTPGGTVFDPPAPIVVTQTWGYRVQSVGDTQKPTVASAAKRQPFTIEVNFSEPVQLASAQNPANYVLAGTSALVIDAVRRTSQCNVVDLSLSQNIVAQNALYKVTVTGVQDQAGNTILSNGTTNVAEFHLKDVYFRGLFDFYLANNSLPPNTFSVEGDLLPLTFSPLCDTGLMTNTGVNNIYQSKVEFCIEKQTGATHAERTMEWKFVHNCTTFEPLANNRSVLLSSSTGFQDTLQAYWNDQDPSQFLTHPVDVIFRADLTGVAAVTDTIAVDGSVLPLTWIFPSVNRMLDNGVAPDAVAGDKIFTKRVRFPANALKNVNYKYARNTAFECTGLPAQGDRNVFVNDAVYDTTGGTLGPLALPIERFGYCQITDKAIKTIFRLAVTPTTWPANGTHTVAVRGSQLPLDWNANLLLRDNGIAPDLAANDDTYSAEATFPDSSYRNVDYKYMIGGVFEAGLNRGLYLNDSQFSVANPIVLVDSLDIPTDAPPGVLARKLILHQNEPNPFNPSTVIAFDAPRPGRYRLAVYNSLGRRVRVLVEGPLAAGPGRVTWDGRDAQGAMAATGIYLYVLEDGTGANRTARKMVLLK